MAKKKQMQVPKKKCRHKKRLAYFHASDVEFTPDQEPFESGTVEKCGVESLWVGFMTALYCIQCKQVVAVDVDPSDVKENG